MNVTGDCDAPVCPEALEKASVSNRKSNLIRKEVPANPLKEKVRTQCETALDDGGL